MPMASCRSYNRLKALSIFAVLAATLFFLGQSPARRVAAQTGASDFKSFESPQVHPLALTPDGTRLLAVNTPDNRLSVFQLTGDTPVLSAEIPVGLEPVSVAARNNQEAWVTNWLSDSVSVIDLTAGNVIRTIDVGDEPTDVVFAGQQREMVFVCVSGLSQVKVYDPNAPAADPQIINIRGKQPRALARDSSGGRVFVSVFESGNNTTIIPATQVTAAGGPPKAFPKMAKRLPPAPEVGLIVKWNGASWIDERGNTKWTQFVPYTLSDVDLTLIDATTTTARIQTEVTGIGTHIGNAVLDSAGSRLYVLNDDAHNEVRFEPNLSGRFISTRVSIVNFGAQAPAITAFDLNPHINLDISSGSDSERAQSLALPADIARSADGTLYVTATGSAKVGIMDQSGAVQARIAVGQGPTGLAIDDPRGRLYVLNRFDEALSIVDVKARAELGRVPIGSFNPEPQTVRDGRRFLYDSSLSAHGDLACASCHLNGHRDGLAWDLGDPKGQLQTQSGSGFSTFHPMKGPMTTQSLRGISGTEPFHWRGDRAGLADFNPAFMSLLGGPRQLTTDEMAAFSNFIGTLAYPPNPNQNLDRTFPNPASGPSAERGRVLFTTGALDGGVLSCNQCHSAFPNFGPGTNRLVIPGALLRESQDFKVPQLRGAYQKLGMLNAGGQQRSGFGFIHDGSIDTLLAFLRVPVFTFRNDDDRRDVEAFVLAFDSGMAPSVGLQLTLTGDSSQGAAASDQINLLMGQADSGNCDLIVKGVYRGEHRGFLYVGGGMFQPDRQNDSQVSWKTLMQSAGPGSELTFTGVPVGYGRRLGIDHNGDGKLDGDV
jgi:YVTN family beta-propeller protein